MVLILTFWLVPVNWTSAVTLREIYSFPRDPSVQSTLIEGNDGAFYGTTAGGGGFGQGSIFRTTTNGEFSTLVSFAWTNGAYPCRVLAKEAMGFSMGRRCAAVPRSMAPFSASI